MKHLAEFASLYRHLGPVQQALIAAGVKSLAGLNRSSNPVSQMYWRLKIKVLNLIYLLLEYAQ
jgi:hypothetical protein